MQSLYQTKLQNCSCDRNISEKKAKILKFKIKKEMQFSHKFNIKIENDQYLRLK